MLDKLLENGFDIAIVSNKIDSAVKSLSAKFFGERIKSAIGEKPSIRHKPEPDMVFMAMEEMGAEFDRRMEASYQVIEEKRQFITEKWEAYEKLTSDKVKEYTSTMSKAQQHALRSMKQFRSNGAAQIAGRVKESIGLLPVVGNKTKNSDEE